MSLNSTIADSITRMRNAIRINRKHVVVRKSKVIRGILETLQREGYIVGYQETPDNSSQGGFAVELKYGPEGEHVIQKIQMVSRGGCRVYKGKDDLDPVLNGMGISVISTNQGILSDREARAKNVGGEVLVEIW